MLPIPAISVKEGRKASNYAKTSLKKQVHQVGRDNRKVKALKKEQMSSI
jgi:hypothetical protein